MRRKHLPLARLHMPFNTQGRPSRGNGTLENKPTRWLAKRRHSRLDQLQALYQLTSALSRTTALEDVYDAALAGLLHALEVDRASILLFDPDGVMRFKAWRGLSDAYRRATEGHTPWSPDTNNPQPVLISDVDANPDVATLRPVICGEGIQALAFVPLIHQGRLLGKFMLYYPTPHHFTDDEVQLAQNIADHIAVAVARRHAEDALRSSEERFRALANAVPTIVWTAAADGTITYANDQWFHYCGLTPQQNAHNWPELVLHPDDRERCLAEWTHALHNGIDYEIEVRNRRYDGQYRWFLTRAVSVRDAEGRVTAWFGTTTDIHDRKRAEAERAELLERERVARAEAQEAVRIRDVFLSVASHELKNPLTALLGQAQLLVRRAERGGTMREQEIHSLNVIAAQASRLNKMILALLDVSRLETGQLSIERAPLDLGALARQVVTEVQPTLEKHTLTYHGPDVPIMIEGDALRLEQVLHNLVQNAIKYSPGGGQVSVRLVPCETTVGVSVTDEGLGIPQEALPRLFHRFYRASNAEEHSIAGMGIGLYVVREIVRLHGGTVTVESTEDVGSTFTIVLPLAKHS
jgi:PAS domain S-box-containing protein